jgi:hypothetical protein
MFGGNNNERGGIRRGHTREDTSVDDKDVVGAVHLGVCVDHGGAACYAAVGSHFRSAEPVVCAAGADIGVCEGHL